MVALECSEKDFSELDEEFDDPFSHQHLAGRALYVMVPFQFAEPLSPVELKWLRTHFGIQLALVKKKCVRGNLQLAIWLSIYTHSARCIVEIHAHENT